MSADEAEFLQQYDVEKYPRPSLAVDVALLSVVEDRLVAVVVRRREHPFVDRVALPGTFVGIDESVDAAAERALRTKLGVRGVFLEQLYTFGAPERDPRTRVVTVAYYALVDARRLVAVTPMTDVVTAPVDVPWQGETGGPVDLVGPGKETLEIAFDHQDILGMAIKRIRGKLDYTPIGFQLLPERFTLRQLQRVHEIVLDRDLNKDSFRRRVLATGQLEATGERQHDVDHRPAALYRFRRRSAV